MGALSRAKPPAGLYRGAPAAGLSPTGLDGKPASARPSPETRHSGGVVISFPRKLGRPSSYSDVLAWEICDRIASGGMNGSLRKVCAADDMPSRTAVLDWLRTNETFRRGYEIACEMRDEAICEEIVEIADAATAATLDRARLMIDVRKWWLAKASPRKYGPRARVLATAETGRRGASILVEGQPLDAWLRAQNASL